MLRIATSLGLLAFGALLVPLLLHLVRRPVRVVKVGNLRPLEHNRRAARSLRWHERLLLLLRCTLLAALAGLLAGLHWEPAAPPPARWLLLAPDATLDATGEAEWARLQAEGFTPHRLTSGFPALAAATTPDAATADTRATDAWSLLRELDARLPSGSEAVVFGPTRADRFHGPRPTLAHVHVRWHRTPEPTPAAVRSAPVRVGLVAAPNREEDARYVRAALTVAGATFATTDETPAWIVQLGEIALPPAWDEGVRQGARLVSDAPDSTAPTRVATWFDHEGTTAHLRQRVTLDAGVPGGRDSQGEPVYSEEPYGQGIHVRFALRFTPDWSDWPLGGAFPAWWRSQLRPGETPVPALAAEQAAPHFAPAAPRARPEFAGYGRVDLRPVCWWVAVLLFALERALSVRASRGKAAA